MSIGDPPPSSRVPVGGSLGWECPRCHATYAPWMATCTECKPTARSLRERIAEAQPPAPLFPAVPYVPPPVYPAPLFPAPQWPYGHVVYCDTLPTTTWLALTPEARMRMTACSGAGQSHTCTVNVGGSIASEQDFVGTIRDMAQRTADWTLNRVRDEQNGDAGDDGTAGVPARI